MEYTTKNGEIAARATVDVIAAGVTYAATSVFGPLGFLAGPLVRGFYNVTVFKDLRTGESDGIQVDDTGYLG